MSQFFASGGQSIGVSASASVLPMNIQNVYVVIFPMVIISMNYKQLFHVSVKSREKTQSKLSLLQKTAFAFLENSVQYHIQNLVLLALNSRACTRGWEASPSP